MKERELLDIVLSAQKTEKVEQALKEYVVANQSTSSFQPVGQRPNNRGAIEVASDAGRSIIERVTNMLDAVLELEHEKHSGKPDCRTPREASMAWLEVPERDGLSKLTNTQRQNLAKSAVLRLESGEGTQARIVTVIDQGIGIRPEELESTILSLNESNKIQKHYLAGTYGQGGSSTYAFCKYTVIVSRRRNVDRVGFTIVQYEDLPAEKFKTGHYVYLVNNNEPLNVEATQADIEYGTIVRHFGYDLTRYTSALGPKSMYGILQRILFDPVSAFRFENRVNEWNRTIKGARNALNGAVDEGDEVTRGPTLDHDVPMFSIELGDHGSISIEYWVLARLKKASGKRKTKPANNFVDSARPVILTHNGQNQGEITGRIIKDSKEGADLPFLQTQGRLICHVNCDRLSPTAKRQLFSSTREQSREGYMLERIKKELVGALQADDELRRLNEEAREQSLREKDEQAKKDMRRRVAKLLRIAGAALYDAGGGKLLIDDGDHPVNPKPPPPKPLPIEVKEPPTFVRIVWDEDREISFYAGQRRYIRVETDANSDYHDSDDLARSRFNIAVGNDLRIFGTSPLRGGRMRVGLEGMESIAEGATGSVLVELHRHGLPVLSDEREYRIVATPKPREPEHKGTLPDFEVIPVTGPRDENWEYICTNPDDSDMTKYASNFVENDGKLYVYYSEVFPRFATEVKRFEQQNEAMASSFRTRYEMWVVVHSLLMYEQLEQEKTSDLTDEQVEGLLQQERMRHGVIAVMMASQEVTTGVASEDDEAAVA